MHEPGAAGGAIRDADGPPTGRGLVVASGLAIAVFIAAGAASVPPSASAKNDADAARLVGAELRAVEFRRVDRVPIVDPVLRRWGVSRPVDVRCRVRDANGVAFEISTDALLAAWDREFETLAAEYRKRLPPEPPEPPEHPLFGVKLGRISARLDELPKPRSAQEATAQLAEVIRGLRAEYGRPAGAVQNAAPDERMQPDGAADVTDADSGGAVAEAPVYCRYHKLPGGGVLASLADGSHVVEAGADGALRIRNLIYDEVELVRSGGR